MSSLDEVIGALKNLEVKRALAVKMVLSGLKVKDICQVLEVSDAFVSKWKGVYEQEGVRGLQVHYRGRSGFLTETQRLQVLIHLRDQPQTPVEHLQDDLERQFGVVYHSKQSYYDLLHAAGLSWHRTQAANPKREAAQVWQTRAEIKKNGWIVRQKFNPVRWSSWPKRSAISSRAMPAVRRGVPVTSA